ncbi:hypothetical protein GC176_20685 [bacterium]|nr:hypothetical protein [bacterium]
MLVASGTSPFDFDRIILSYNADRPAVRHPRRRKTEHPTVAHYAVTGKVVPRLTEALRIGERVHRVLMGCSKRVQGDDNAAEGFSGKRPDGAPLDDSHQHAHFLCEAASGSAKITQFTVYAPMGFSQQDEEALASFTRTYGDDGHDLQFVLLGIGHPKDFAETADRTNEKVGQSLILAESQTWISRTPFVLTRHLKLKGASRNDPSAWGGNSARPCGSNSLVGRHWQTWLRQRRLNFCHKAKKAEHNSAAQKHSGSNSAVNAQTAMAVTQARLVTASG